MEWSKIVAADGAAASSSLEVVSEVQNMLFSEGALGVPGGGDGVEMQLPCQAAIPTSNPNRPPVRGEKVMGQGSDGLACSFSWVIEMEEKINNFDPFEECAMVRKTIYTVPQAIKDETNSKAYQPQFVSLGPLHHGEPHLLPMEEWKQRAVLHMVNREKKPLRQFLAAVMEVADELEGAYDGLDDNWRGANRGKFVRVMFTDGCFLLELLRLGQLDGEKLCMEFEAHNPALSCRLRFFSQIVRDMIAIENQLPLLVLQQLLYVQHGTSTGAEVINNLVQKFLPGMGKFSDIKIMGAPAPTPWCCIGMKRWWRRSRETYYSYEEERVEKQEESEEEASPAELGLHILDIYHESYCGSCPNRKQSGDECENIDLTLCAVELSDAGIQFKNTKTDNIHDIDFKNGVLSMPQFRIYDNTEIRLLNLLAFELLHYIRFQGTVSSYISFMDKIIESERDVALLRSEGVLVNMTGSDKKVVEMFNTLTRLTTALTTDTILGDVQAKMNSHCRKRRNKWRASFVRTYLSNPWVFISLVAAIILVVATLFQTAYTIVPFYTKG